MNIKKKEKQNVIQINISFPKHYNKYFLFFASYDKSDLMIITNNNKYKKFTNFSYKNS